MGRSTVDRDYMVGQTVAVKDNRGNNPFINLVAKVSPDDYSALGFRINQKRATSVVLPAMADTGCQSCLAELKVVYRHGLQRVRPHTRNYENAYCYQPWHNDPWCYHSLP